MEGIFSIAAILILVALVLVLLIGNIHIVQQSKAYVVERLCLSRSASN